MDQHLCFRITPRYAWMKKGSIECHLHLVALALGYSVRTIIRKTKFCGLYTNFQLESFLHLSTDDLEEAQRQFKHYAWVNFGVMLIPDLSLEEVVLARESLYPHGAVRGRGEDE